jgi:hypothetical protein
LLASVLPSRVGSPLSINNLRQDLEVAFYQVHTGTKDVEFAGHRARILPLTALAGILKV